MWGWAYLPAERGRARAGSTGTSANENANASLGVNWRNGSRNGSGVNEVSGVTSERRLPGWCGNVVWAGFVCVRGKAAGLRRHVKYKMKMSMSILGTFQQIKR